MQNNSCVALCYYVESVGMKCFIHFSYLFFCFLLFSLSAQIASQAKSVVKNENITIYMHNKIYIYIYSLKAKDKIKQKPMMACSRGAAENEDKEDKMTEIKSCLGF